MTSPICSLHGNSLRPLRALSKNSLTTPAVKEFFADSSLIGISLSFSARKEAAGIFTCVPERRPGSGKPSALHEKRLLEKGGHGRSFGVRRHSTVRPPVSRQARRKNPAQARCLCQKAPLFPHPAPAPQKGRRKKEGDGPHRPPVPLPAAVSRRLTLSLPRPFPQTALFLPCSARGSLPQSAPLRPRPTPGTGTADRPPQ